MGIKESYAALQKEIAQACAPIRRDHKAITVVGVSKGHPISAIREAVAAGIKDIGENREQELSEKFPELTELGADIHFIGHLQGNKVKSVVEMADYIHSVDSLSLLRKIHYASQDMDKVQNIFLEVNTSGEAQKYGMKPEEVETMLTIMKNLPYGNVKFIGLMTMAPLTDDMNVARECFRKLHDIKEHLNLHHLSMGMSSDFRVAIEEGATVLRIGRKIFGESEGGR